MKTRHYIYILVLFAGFFFVQYDLSKRIELAEVLNTKNKSVAQNSLPTDPVIAISEPPQPDSAKPSKPEAFLQQFKKESLQIAKLQNNPELVQSRMNELALLMTAQDVQVLFDIISDDKNDGDQRALAVELLSLKNDTASLIALQNFVANNTTVNGNKWDRKKELETILRAQAVESIAAYPQKDIALSTLSYLQEKVDEKFLNDRIGRASASLSGKAPTLKQQDDEALKKLLE